MNNERWIRYTGSQELPVRSLQPAIVTSTQFGTVAVYYLDNARLTPEQRGALAAAFVYHTGQLTAWDEYVAAGLPILASDCEPIQ